MKRSKKFRWFIFPGIMVVLALAFSPNFVRSTYASSSLPVEKKSIPATQATGQKLIVRRFI